MYIVEPSEIQSEDGILISLSGSVKYCLVLFDLSIEQKRQINDHLLLITTDEVKFLHPPLFNKQRHQKV